MIILKAFGMCAVRSETFYPDSSFISSWLFSSFNFKMTVRRYISCIVFYIETFSWLYMSQPEAPLLLDTREAVTEEAR